VVIASRKLDNCRALVEGPGQRGLARQMLKV
jgi:hypothetical protein